MKKLTKTKIMLLAACLLGVGACSDNDGDSLSRIAKADAATFTALREQALNELKQTETFKAEDGIEFTSDKGVKLYIYGGCLSDQAGNQVSGDVTLSFVELFDRGNMLVSNKALMGINDEGGKEPLITGGQFNIELKQGDKVLKSGCNFYMEVPAANTGSLDPEMGYWRGTFDENGNLVWEEATGEDGIERGVGVDDGLAMYTIFEGEFGWINIDRFMEDTRPKAAIKVAVPEGYDNKNSGVYLVFEDTPNLLAQLDIYNKKEGYFTEHYGFIPIGMNVHVIFISESNGQLVYASKPVTMAAGSTVTIDEADLHTITKSKLVDLINALN